MLDMLLGTDLTMTQKDFAQTAQSCGKNLIRLINDVLDRAKFEAGRLELEAVPFDLRSLMDDVISLFPSKLKEKSIEVSYYYKHRTFWFLYTHCQLVIMGVDCLLSFFLIECKQLIQTPIFPISLFLQRIIPNILLIAAACSVCVR
jgi:signal transduction histidine kinase